MRNVCLFICSFVVILISGCSSINSDEFIKGLKPQHSNYKLHLFYEGDTPRNEMNEVQTFIHSNPVFLDNISEVVGHSENRRLNKNLKKLGMKTYPMYVLVNKEGIVYNSPHLSKMEEVIKKELKVS